MMINKMDFLNIAIIHAKPYSLSNECQHEIEKIIKMGSVSLSTIGNDKQSIVLEKAKVDLMRLIEEAKKNADKNSLTLTDKDIEYAKNAICPTWPCS